MNLIITGATRGLGLSHAMYFSKKGFNIALVDISEDACKVYKEVDDLNHLIRMLSKNNSKIKFYKCDLTDFSLTEKIFENIFNDFTKISAGVFTAGGDIAGNDKKAAGGKAKINNFEIAETDHDIIFNRNYKTTLNSIKALVPHLKKNNFGKIVTTSSVSANYGVVNETAYSISKAAVVQLTRSVASEMRDYGINVNCISPAATLTGRFLATLKNRSKEDQEKIKNSGNSILKKPAKPDYISSVVDFLISDKSKYISGQVIRIDGGQFTFPT